jgi:hypothetical protein
MTSSLPRTAKIIALEERIGTLEIPESGLTLRQIAYCLSVPGRLENQDLAFAIAHLEDAGVFTAQYRRGWRHHRQGRVVYYPTGRAVRAYSRRRS